MGPQPNALAGSGEDGVVLWNDVADSQVSTLPPGPQVPFLQPHPLSAFTLFAYPC